MVEHDTFNDSAYHYIKHGGHKGNYIMANTNHGLHLKNKKIVLKGPETKSCAKNGVAWFDNIHQKEFRCWHERAEMPYSTAITLKLRLNMNLSAELKYVIMTYKNFNSPFRQYFRMQLIVVKW